MKKLRVEDIDVDDIWRAVGSRGKYQLKQLVSFQLCVLSWALHQLSIVFIGYRPGFHCKTAPNASRVTNFTAMEKVYRECEILTYTNTTDAVMETSTPCDNGWVYDIPTEQSFVTEWDFVCDNAELAELTNTLMYIGMMAGDFVFPSISDRIGRKPVSVFSHICIFGIVLGTAFSSNYYVFVVLRVFTGFLTQGFSASMTLSLEILPTEIRHWSQIISSIVWTSSICLMSPIAYALRNVSWRYLQITYALVSTVSLVQWWYVYRSKLLKNKRNRSSTNE